MKHLQLYLVGILLCLTVTSIRAHADEMIPDPPPSVFLSFGAEYAAGNYGTANTIRSLYLPLTVTWIANDRVDLGIEIPILYQNNGTVTTSLYHGGWMTTDTPTAESTMGGGMGDGMGGGPGGSGPMRGKNSAVAGLGDIILRAGAIALHEQEGLPQLRASLFVKCPTASSADGLGTGELDAGGGLDVSKWLDDLHLVGEGLYNYQGRVPGFGLKNYFSFSAGAGYQATATFQPMLLLKGATAPSSFADNLLEVRVHGIWTLSSTTSLDGYVLRGLSDSSPDYGGGMAVTHAF